MLPELKTGDEILTRRGTRCRVRIVRRPRRDTGFEEPLYRLDYGSLTGRREWTLEELNDEGVTLCVALTE